MRIGIDARLVGYRRGGIASYVRSLLRHLAEVDQENEYVVFTGRRGALTVGGANFRRWRLWTPPHHRLEQTLLPLEMGMARVDILHSPDFIPVFRRRWRAVITVHDLAFLRWPQQLTAASRYYYGQIERAVRESEAVIAVSQSTRRDLVELVGAPSQKVHVVYEAASPLYRPLEGPFCQEMVRRRWGLAGRYILFVGTLEPRKNLPTLLAALAEAKGKGALREAKLVLAGERGWLDEEVFQTVAELALGEEVVFLGPVEPQELLFLYNAALFLAHPALYEGFGLTVVEAMACGTPVLAAHTSSLPEVVGKAGLLVPPEDVAAWAEAMARLAEEAALRRRLGRLGLKQAQRFSWHEAARQTLAVYREAMA